MTIKNGDLPAMPLDRDAELQSPFPKAETYGLTKREYIAALVMQGFLSNMECMFEARTNGINVVDWIARQSLIAADALLKEMEDSK